MKRLAWLIVSLLHLPLCWAADDQPAKKYIPSIGWSLDAVLDNTNIGTVTGTNVAFTDLLNCAAITTDANGNFVCSAAAAGSGDITAVTAGNGLTGGAASGAATLDVGEGLAIDAAADSVAFDPTELTGSRTWSDGSTDTNVWTLNRLSGTDPTITFGSATVTGQVVAASTAFEVNGEQVSDFTGTGLTIVGGALTASGFAPTDADYLVGTANGSLSAEIVVGTTPGGELGNTWASPTLDDSVSVSSWTLTDAVAATSFQLPNGTNPTVDAAGEIAEDTTDTQLLLGAAPNVFPATVRECHTIENLVAADDNVLFLVARNDLTAVASHCRTAGFTTQPTIVWEDGTGNAMTGSPTCNATESQAATAISLAGAVTQNEAIRFDNTATTAPVTGTQTTLCIDYTWSRK